MSKRPPITWRMKIDSLLGWATVRCTECGQPITPGSEIEFDHVHALVHGGDHHWSNLRPVHAQCHTEKTIRDIKANAKVKRTPESKDV